MHESPASTALRVRALMPEDDALLSLLSLDDEDTSRVRSAAAYHPLCALVCVSERAPQAVLVGAFTALGYRILELWPEQPPAEATHALVSFVVRECAGQRVEAVTSTMADPMCAQLRALGFETIEHRQRYRRDLDRSLEPGDAPFELVPVRDLGRAALHRALRRCLDEPALARLRMTVDERLATLLRLADHEGRPDVSLWYAARRDGDIVGLSLASVHDASGRGTVLYIGMVPEARGHGLGGLLHARALAQLAAAGATHYVDQTAADNHAMRRVFERNGCTPAEQSHLWLLPRPSRPRVFDSFDSLVHHLTGQGVAVQARGGGGWLCAPIRIAEDKAEVEIVWLEDSRLVHLVHVFPWPIPEGALGEVARAVCSINKDLDLPGFVLDESSRSLRCQMTLVLDSAGSVSSEAVWRVMSTLVTTVARSLPRWEALGVAPPKSARAAAWASMWAE